MPRIWNTPKRGTQNEQYVQSNVSQSPFKGTLFARRMCYHPFPSDLYLLHLLLHQLQAPAQRPHVTPVLWGAHAGRARVIHGILRRGPFCEKSWTDLNCYEFQGPLVLRISFAIVWCNLLTNREVVSSADSKETKTKGCAMAPSALPGLNRGLDRAWMIKHLEDSSACDMCGCLRRFSTVS